VSQAVDRVWEHLHETQPTLVEPPRSYGDANWALAALERELQARSDLGTMGFLHEQEERTSRCDCGSLYYQSIETVDACLHPHGPGNEAATQTLQEFVQGRVDAEAKVVYHFSDEVKDVAPTHRRCSGECGSLPAQYRKVLQAATILKMVAYAGDTWDLTDTSTVRYHGYPYKLVGAAVHLPVHYVAFVQHENYGLCFYDDMKGGQLFRVTPADLELYKNHSKTLYFRLVNAPRIDPTGEPETVHIYSPGVTGQVVNLITPVVTPVQSQDLFLVPSTA
jgi:hypothetical protein